MWTEKTHPPTRNSGAVVWTWGPRRPLPVQGAAWGKLGGRIVISSGVFLNYTTSYLSPGGAAGGQIDKWIDGRPEVGRVGRAGEVPAAMVSPRHGPTDTSLCAAKAPQGRFYGWVPGPRSPGPPAPSSPRNPGILSRTHNLSPSPPLSRPEIQTSALLPQTQGFLP